MEYGFIGLGNMGALLYAAYHDTRCYESPLKPEYSLAGRESDTRCISYESQRARCAESRLEIAHRDADLLLL